MSFCTKCGASINMDAKFCPSCGTPNAASEPAGPSAAVPPSSAPFNAAPASNQVNTPLGNIDFSFNAPTAGVADPQDVAANKGTAILSYLIFFIPLLTGTHKTSPFVRFHVNQGTALFLAALVYSIALTIVSSMLSLALPSLRYPHNLGLVFSYLRLVPCVLVVVGIVNAAKGTLKQLPVIGGLNIIK